MHGRGQHERDQHAQAGPGRPGRRAAAAPAAVAAAVAGAASSSWCPRARRTPTTASRSSRSRSGGPGCGRLPVLRRAGRCLLGAGRVRPGGRQPQAGQRRRSPQPGAIGLSGVALVADLGRPERFLNMLRVFKPSSPMSVGSWLISAFGGASAAAAACAVTGRLPKAGAAATAGAAAGGPGHLHVHGRADLRHGGARLARGAPRDALPVRRVGRQRGGRPGHDGRARRGRGAGHPVRGAGRRHRAHRQEPAAQAPGRDRRAVPERAGREGRWRWPRSSPRPGWPGRCWAAGAGPRSAGRRGAGGVLRADPARYLRGGPGLGPRPEYVVRPQRERLAAKARELAP